MESSPVDVGLVVSGTFYTLIATWWWLQVTKRYAACKEKRVDYTSAVTYPCCYSCRRIPVEGIVKLIFCCFLAVLGAYRASQSDLESSMNGDVKDRGIAQLTVFLVFAASAVCDIMSHLCQRFVFPSLDYFLLIFAFTVQGVVSVTYSDKDLTSSALAVGDNLTMLSAAGAALSILLEFRQRTFVWFSLGRSYFTLVLGTWLWHMGYLLKHVTVTYSDNLNSTISLTLSTNQSLSLTQTINDPSSSAEQSLSTVQTMKFHDGLMPKTAHLPFSTDRYNGTESLIYLPLYYTWYCLLDAAFLLILWLITFKLASHNKCLCMPVDEETVSHFENRVHFDYHILDRLDSDMD